MGDVGRWRACLHSLMRIIWAIKVAPSSGGASAAVGRSCLAAAAAYRFCMLLVACVLFAYRCVLLNPSTKKREGIQYA